MNAKVPNLSIAMNAKVPGEKDDARSLSSMRAGVHVTDSLLRYASIGVGAGYRVTMVMGLMENSKEIFEIRFRTILS